MECSTPQAGRRQLDTPLTSSKPVRQGVAIQPTAFVSEQECEHLSRQIEHLQGLVDAAAVEAVQQTETIQRLREKARGAVALNAVAQSKDEATRDSANMLLLAEIEEKQRIIDTLRAELKDASSRARDASSNADAEIEREALLKDLERIRAQRNKQSVFIKSLQTAARDRADLQQDLEQAQACLSEEKTKAAEACAENLVALASLEERSRLAIDAERQKRLAAVQRLKELQSEHNKSRQRINELEAAARGTTTDSDMHTARDDEPFASHDDTSSSRVNHQDDGPKSGKTRRDAVHAWREDDKPPDYDAEGV